MKRRIRKIAAYAVIAFALYVIVVPLFVFMLVRDVMASRRLRNDDKLTEQISVELGRNGLTLTWYSPRCWTDIDERPSRVEECAARVPTFGEVVSISVVHYVNPDHRDIPPEIQPQIGRQYEHTFSPRMALESNSPIWSKSIELLNNCRLSYVSGHPATLLPPPLSSYQ